MDKLYPDEGPLRRELYPRHMRMLAAGAKHTERVCLGGNRIGKCATSSTLIDTPHGSVSMGELYDRGRPFDVWGWDGRAPVHARASAPFKLPQEPIFRLTLSSGRWIEVAGRHRLFCSDGSWHYVEQLLLNGAFRLPTTAALGRQAHAVSLAFVPDRQPAWSLSSLSNLSPYAPPLLLGGDRITGIDYVGRQDVYDFSVSEHHSYISGGYINHNSYSIGGYEVAAHLTGLYPDWWVGRRFTDPILVWACGTKSAKTRDINQRLLLGSLRRTAAVTVTSKEGLIPSRVVSRVTRKSGISDAVDTAYIRHAEGHENRLMFKSYEEGRTAFEGEAAHFIWLDEEPTKAIYDECMMRLLTTQGLIMVTLTPVEGMTEVVLNLLEGTEFLS